jgi:DNA-binding Lrp family transcriptional regulator
MTNVKLDEKNRKILEQLLQNSRLSCREIARNLKLSPTSVLLRIKDMERKGIIKGYTTILDHEILGYELTAIIEITVSRGKLLQVERQIAKIPNVLAVYDITGLTDAMVIVKFKTRKELSKFVKKLLALPFVERTNTHLVLTTIKEDFRLL